MAKLISSNDSTWFKFASIGDEVCGTFVNFTEDVPGKFGAEQVLTIVDDDGRPLKIRCAAALARTLRENRRHLQPGATLKIKYVRDVPTTKGNPAKIFDVDVEPPTGSKAITPSPAALANDDPMPF